MRKIFSAFYSKKSKIENLLIFLLLLGLIVIAFYIIHFFYLTFATNQAEAAQSTVDSTIHTTSASHNGSSPTTVFISTSTGYAFYRDSGGACVYSKTTNGGVTWGTAVAVSSFTDCISVAVWYDRWTPNNTTGNLIHIATIDTANDDIFYRQLNTTNDSLSTQINITSGVGYAGTLTAGVNYVTITRNSDGDLFAAVTDTSDNIMVRCVSTCTSATSWSVSEPPSWTTGDDYQILVPMLGNFSIYSSSTKTMLIWWDVSVGNILYSIWNGTTWSSFTSVPSMCCSTPNATYDAPFGAAVRIDINGQGNNGDIFLAAVLGNQTLGTDDQINFIIYNPFFNNWYNNTVVVSNSVCANSSNCGITGVKIARDQATGYLYLLYTARSTAGTASTTNIYLRYSTNNGTTWSQELGPIAASNDDIYGARLSLSAVSSTPTLIYTTWYGATPDSLFGRPLSPKHFTQSAYRFFDNNNSTNVGSPLAAQDTPVTLSTSGATFRLRMLLHLNSADLLKSEGNFKLQYAGKGTGSCNNPNGTPNWTDISTTTLIAYYDNTTPVDGADLTSNANDPTHGGDVIVNQTYEELNNFSNNPTTGGVINNGQDGKWDFSLKDNNAPAGTTYCLRIVLTDNRVLDNYSVFPEVTTKPLPSISCSTNVSSVSFGQMNNSNIFTATPNASTTVSCNYTNAGCSLYIKDSGNGTNSGLYKSNNPTYLINSADTTLTAGTNGYGIQATTTSAGSGALLSLNSKYNKTGNLVGGLTITNTLLASSTSDITGREVVVTHKAAVSSQALSGNYTDTITYECVAN